MSITDEIRQLQARLGVRPDGIVGRQTLAAMQAALDQLSRASSDVPHFPIIAAHLRREEGVIPHAYQDHLGFWTIGVGRLIDKRKGGRLTDEEIDCLLANDIRRFVTAMEDWPAWQAVKDDPYRATALLSMCFQMGPVGLGKFKNTLALIASKQWQVAADNMLQSLWAKQTPARAKRVAHMIATGTAA